MKLFSVLLVLISFIISLVNSVKFYKSRAEVLAMIGEQERKLYFGSCEQSSQRSSCVFAVDESYSQEPTQCAVTSSEEKPWWMAVLETPSYVTKVTVLNMDQSYRAHPDALRSVTIMANDIICFKYESAESFVKRSFPCDTVADQIMLRSNMDLGVLAICDVEVFGAPLKFPGILGDPKLLVPRSCMQSSVSGGNGYCENAFDGKVSKNDACSVTSAEARPWLEVYLLTPSLVTEVRIYAKDDCCQEGLSSITITLNNRECTKHEGQFKYKAFPCKYFGDTLRVQSETQNSLVICELQLLGYKALLEEPPRYKYLGCYKDDAKSRDLDNLASSIIMSYDKCHKICKRNGQKYFGVQNGKHCWCGSAFGKHGKLDDKACNVPCEDDEKSACGGPMANNVFEVL